MRERAMRLIVYFDLPVKTANDRRAYNKFRKHLIMQGFIMIQESVYSKIAVNSSAADVIKKDLREHRPSSGNIQILSVSERQYQDIEFLVGEARKEIVDTMDRFLIL